VKTLLKYHSSLILLGSASDYDINASGGVGFNQGWRKLNGLTFVSERILDCAGLAMEEETLFFDGITVQDGGVGAGAIGGPGDSFVVMDIVSSVPLDIDNDFGKILLHGAGFPSGGMSNFEHIPYSKTTRYTLDIDTGAAFAFKAYSEQSGSMEPTASDRLYIYRLVLVSNFSTLLTSLTVPSARVLFALNTKEEPTFEYLMRLMRSYDLQQSLDVD